MPEHVDQIVESGQHDDELTSCGGDEEELGQPGRFNGNTELDQRPQLLDEPKTSNERERFQQLVDQRNCPRKEKKRKKPTLISNWLSHSSQRP